MKQMFLDFESALVDLDAQIEALRNLQSDTPVDIESQLSQLEQKSAELLADLYARLTPWQVSQVARHPQRPYTLDYISLMMTEFEELHGDRHFADDASIVGGLARIDGIPVMVIGHQKGRDVRERTRRNFGMPRPEGYRKALRLMKTAEKFGLPVVTLIDTPGAYPGIDAEERGQSEAIGRNLLEMAQLRVPIVSVVIGEGGSGGALALAVADRILMLQYSTYSVISPEGCASILWRSAERAPDAAQALGITAERLKPLGLIDEIIAEPVGGAHRNPEQMAATLKSTLVRELNRLMKLAPEQLLSVRHKKTLSYGKYKVA